MQISTRIQNNIIFLFFVFLCIFPTFRVLTIGSSSSSSAGEFVIAALPEVLLVLLSFRYFLKFLKYNRPKVHFLDILVGVYALYGIIAGFSLANDFKASLYGLRLSYLPIGFYYLASWSHFKWETLERILHWIFTLSLWISLVGLIIYFIFPSLQTYMNSLVTERQQATYFVVRMTSIFWTPVVFGVLVCASVLYWMYRYLSDPKGLYLLYLLLLFACLFLSVSRGPMIGGFLGIILMILLARQWKKGGLILGLFLVSYLVSSFYIKSPVELTKWIFYSSQATVEMDEEDTRVALANDAIEKIKANPMGLGLGNAGHVAVQLNSENRADISLTSTDGWYIKLLLETGFVSLFLYVLLLFGFVVAYWQYFKKHHFDILTFTFVFGAVVTLQCLVSNVLDFYFFSYLYWFILGVAVYLLKNVKQNEA